MLKLLLLFIVLLLASYGVNWLEGNSGTLELNWLGYNIETTVSFAIIFLAIFFILISIIFQILGGFIGIPTYLKRRAKQKMVDKSLSNISQGYAALLSGDVETARKNVDKLKKLANQSDSAKDIKNITKMLDAKVAQEEGNLLIANHGFNELLEDKSNEFFATKGLLDSAFKAGDINKSIELAEKAYSLKPNIKNGAHSLLELYKKTDNWEKAETFLNKYRKRHSFKKDKYNNIDINKEFSLIWFNKAKALNPSPSQKPAMNEIAYNYLDKALKNSPDSENILIEYITAAKLLEKNKAIKNRVEDFWKRNQSLDILNLYIDSILERDEKSTLKKRTKALDQLETINKSPYIDSIRNSLIIPEIS